MEIHQDVASSATSVNQTSYIKDIGARLNRQAAKPIYNLCAVSVKLSAKDKPTDEPERADMRKKPFRSLVGCLLYVATCTIPDFAYTVTRLRRQVEGPGRARCVTSIPVLRYLLLTNKYGSQYVGGNGNPRFMAFYEADWASNANDYRSYLVWCS